MSHFTDESISEAISKEISKSISEAREVEMEKFRDECRKIRSDWISEAISRELDRQFDEAFEAYYASYEETYPSDQLVPFPTKKPIYCVLGFPYVDKDSREHFEIRGHKRIIEIYYELDGPIFDFLSEADLPPGIFYRICLS